MILLLMNLFAKKRINFFLFFFLIWTSVILLRLYQITAVDSDYFLNYFKGKTWKTGTIPALRGRLLDRNGQLIAWSVRKFSLYYKVTTGNKDSVDIDLQKLNKLIQIQLSLVDDAATNSLVLLKSNLKPVELLKLERFMKDNPQFYVKSYFEREKFNDRRDVKRIIGRTSIQKDNEIGVSGLERQFNDRLVGKDGKYRVMIDKNNEWILETWKEIQPPVPGFDVYLANSI